MFPNGHRVEVVTGALANCEGIAVSHAEAVSRNLATADQLSPTANEVWVVLTFWGQDILVSLSPHVLRAI